MAGTGDVEDILATLAVIAEDSTEYAARWKAEHGGKVIGVFPMNFPSEIVHAAGALPVVVQESRAAITLGRSLMYEFYCGYTRSVADQSATQQFDVFDGFFLVDHCVALLGAVDAMRFAIPDTPVHLAQYTASMDEAWTPIEIREKVAELRHELETFCGTTITDAHLSISIRAYNRNRQLQRHIYDLRRSGRTALTARQMQVIVKSSMVMEVEEHNIRLARLIAALESEQAAAPRLVKLHLSGHFCHAPRPELLDMIESCGAVVVDDDLFTGYRYISTDVPENVDPTDALVRWYFDRNDNVPCATRAQKTVDWETYLTNSLAKSGAEGVIILMAKFCEPHMLYYPELRKELNRTEMPHLLIETEHEGLALEMLRTRVETLVERIRRPARREPALA